MFKDTFLAALGAWQRGWREDQSKRVQLAADLETEISELQPQFRRVDTPCYRKRFLHPADLPKLFFEGALYEGITSWTTDFTYAQEFKGLQRDNAVTAAIFSHRPSPEEVLVNITALWQNPTFRASANAYKERGGEHSDALFNFADKQGEVILSAPVRLPDILGFTGKSSPFDDLCDQAGIHGDDKRDLIFKQLVQTGKFPEQYQWILQARALRVVSNSIDRIMEVLDNLSKPKNDP
ncbi:hypothetical protein [Thalassospira alkalitolerans]|uniref:hypothetical protein n=1 Tax=Thalassospira alkalitolerans TaxID=1293890 RepID=UPI0030EB2213|tara:strand:- start:35489 stop:36199 length:711 start_codon:yes stop_codon:yes gene_type:complete